MKIRARSLFTLAGNAPLIENVSLHRDSQGNLHFNKDVQLESGVERRRMILPFLVNAHTHLELSVYSNKIKKNIDFVSWLKSLNELNKNITLHDIVPAMQKSLIDTWSCGTGVLIDICNDLSSWSNVALPNDQQEILIFNELIGFDPTRADEVLKAGKMNINALQLEGKHQAFPTPHAFYSTSAKLCSGIRKNSPLPISVHLAEHDAEIKMFKSRSGPMVDFMNSIGVWDEKWNPLHQELISYAFANNLLVKGDLAVHLVKADSDELELISDKGIIPCLCPRSNDYYNNGQPLVREMLNLGMRPLLGTDSLASNSSLNMIDEMRFAMKHWPEVHPLKILEMATVNINQFEPFKNLSKFFPIISGQNQPFIELIFKSEIKDPFESLKSDQILEQNIHV